MGYTHYWRRSKDFTDKDWGNIAVAVQKICAAAKQDGVTLWKEYDEPGTQIFVGPDHLQFNGAGIDGHETFVVSRSSKEFEFCKTACKPYDTAVTAMLAYLGSIYPDVKVSSDGEGDDWIAGVKLAREAIPELDWKIACPLTDDDEEEDAA